MAKPRSVALTTTSSRCDRFASLAYLFCIFQDTPIKILKVDKSATVVGHPVHPQEVTASQPEVTSKYEVDPNSSMGSLMSIAAERKIRERNPDEWSQ